MFVAPVFAQREPYCWFPAVELLNCGSTCTRYTDQTRVSSAMSDGVRMTPPPRVSVAGMDIAGQ